MKLPQNMTQVTFTGRSVSDYEVILPKGAYTSGTYAIPNGRTWNDFKLIIGVLGVSATARSSCTLLDEQITSTSWKTNMNPDGGGGSSSYIQRASASSFSVGRAGSGQISMLIGYLK
jgi:hypothetical protein